MENAPVLARAIYNAVTGFNFVTVAAGLQFSQSGAFGLLGAMDVSGTFGPLPVDCATSGSASLSGTKAISTTFSSGDSLDATFDACTRGSETLRGSMGLSIDLFEEVVGATRGQQLSGASVSTEVTSVVSRQSSGVMTSEDLVGSYSYRSVTPDRFLLDGLAETGPYAGELLVVAGDNSSMRMVAVDEFNLRLDLDFDGDDVIDESIPTTYSTLAYGDWYCWLN